MTYTDIARKVKLSRTILVRLVEDHYGHLPECSEEILEKTMELIKAKPPRKLPRYTQETYWKAYDKLLEKGYLNYEDLGKLFPGRKGNWKSIFDNMAKMSYRDDRPMLIYEDTIGKQPIIRPFRREFI